MFCRKNKFNKLKTHAQKKQKEKEKEMNVYNAASESYNDLLETYFDQYNDIY